MACPNAAHAPLLSLDDAAARRAGTAGRYPREHTGAREDDLGQVLNEPDRG